MPASITEARDAATKYCASCYTYTRKTVRMNEPTHQHAYMSTVQAYIHTCMHTLMYTHIDMMVGQAKLECGTRVRRSSASCSEEVILTLFPDR